MYGLSLKMTPQNSCSIEYTIYILYSKSKNAVFNTYKKVLLKILFYLYGSKKKCLANFLKV